MGGSVHSPRAPSNTSRNPARLTDVAGRLLSRDPDALYRELKPFVSRIARSLVGHEPGDDLVHEVCTETILSLGRYRQECSFPSWVHAIAARHVKKLVRAERRHRELLNQVAIQAALRASLSSADEPSVSVTLERLRRALATLPDRQRLCLELVQFAGQTPRAVAAQLGITPEAVRKNVHRARTHLRAWFETESIHPGVRRGNQCRRP